MILWDFRDVDVCPLCNEPEDNLHVVKCVSASANATCDASLDNLEQLLLNDHTPQTIVSMILQQLRLWRGDDQIIPSPCYPILQAVVVAQTLIGWQVFMEGCLSVEWRAQASTFLPKNAVQDDGL